MKKLLILTLLLLTACGPVVHEFKPIVGTLGFPPTVPVPNNVPDTLTETAPFAPEIVPDFLADLPASTCDSGATPADGEGPYYKADTPERTSLYEEGLTGKKLILAGFVSNADCFPMRGVWLDFWQANADGIYDNQGYTLRGHQFTDSKGRYYLETVMPGLYPERPIEHIHVKLQVPNGEIFTTQLYFPQQPIEGRTISLEDKGDYYLGIFNFVLP